MVYYSDDALDSVFHALADRTRRSMLARLKTGEISISELADPFAMTLPGVSKHILVLERAGLVHRTKTGRIRRVQLDAGPLRAAASWVEAYRAFWDDAFDALERRLGRDPAKTQATKRSES